MRVQRPDGRHARIVASTNSTPTLAILILSLRTPPKPVRHFRGLSTRRCHTSLPSPSLPLRHRHLRTSLPALSADRGTGADRGALASCDDALMERFPPAPLPPAPLCRAGLLHALHGLGRRRPTCSAQQRLCPLPDTTLWRRCPSVAAAAPVVGVAFYNSHLPCARDSIAQQLAHACSPLACQAEHHRPPRTSASGQLQQPPRCARRHVHLRLDLATVT